MDWMYDELFNGKRICILTVVDTWSRICPVMCVTRSATAWSVELDPVVSEHGVDFVGDSGDQAEQELS